MCGIDRAWLIALTFVLAGVPAWAGSPRPLKIFAKPGVPSAFMEADLADCVAHSANVSAIPSSVALATTNGGVLGALLFEDIAGNPAEREAKRVFVAKCMRDLGYVGIPLTSDEAKAMRAQPDTTALARWRANFYANPDFSKRLEATRHPVVPPLPEDSLGGGAYGAVRLDPSRMVAASGVLERGSLLLKGPAAYRATAVVKSDVAIQSGFGLNVRAGTLLHLLVADATDGSDQAYWCGPMITHSIWGPVTFAACVTTDEFGYVVFTALGAPWLATGILPPLGVNRWTSASVDFSLLQTESNDQPPLTFDMKLTGLNSSGVTVTAIVRRNGKTETFWTGSAPFDGQGAAVVPFWAYRLTITRVGTGVSVAFDATGDGTGWDPAAAN
jgi:hypothetical protein